MGEAHYMHVKTGACATREDWVSAYTVEELEQRGLTAEQAFEADEGITLILTAEGEAPADDDTGTD